MRQGGGGRRAELLPGDRRCSPAGRLMAGSITPPPPSPSHIYSHYYYSYAAPERPRKARNTSSDIDLTKLSFRVPAIIRQDDLNLKRVETQESDPMSLPEHGHEYIHRHIAGSFFCGITRYFRVLLAYSSGLYNIQ